MEVFSLKFPEDCPEFCKNPGSGRQMSKHSRLAFMADLAVHADMLKNEFGEPLQREEAGEFTEKHLF